MHTTNILMSSCAKCGALTMGMPPCDVCKKHYCIPHRLPEVHGCGDALRNKAQTDNTVAANKKRQEKREHDHKDAKAKLDAKRKELAAARAKKPSATSKKTT